MTNEEYKYQTLHTFGFLHGYLDNVDNDFLKKSAIENYKNRMSDNNNESRSEDIIIPPNPEVHKVADRMSKVYEKHFSRKLIISPGEYSHWAQVHFKGESTQYHMHFSGDTDVVGVYYVDVPENSGDLILKFKRHEFDSSKWFFTPQTNKFIIFDASMEHGVSVNKNDDPRVCISINFKSVIWPTITK